MQEIILGCTGILAAISYAVSGFGPAITFLFSWFSFDTLNLLDKTSDMVDCQAIMICMIFTMCMLNAIFHRNHSFHCKTIIFITFLQTSGIIIGIEILIAFGNNIWLKRGFGIFFFVIFGIQNAGWHDDKNKNLTVRAYSISESWIDFWAIGVARFSAGVLAGVIGAGGPPLMILTMFRNYGKEDTINYGSVASTFSALTKIIYMLLRFHSFKKELLGCYLSSIGGTFIGFFLGLMIRDYMDQKLFRIWIQALLFMSSITMITMGFPWSKWVMGSSFLISIFVIMYLIKNRSANENLDPENRNPESEN